MINVFPLLILATVQNNSIFLAKLRIVSEQIFLVWLEETRGNCSQNSRTKISQKISQPPKNSFESLTPLRVEKCVIKVLIGLLGNNIMILCFRKVSNCDIFNDSYLNNYDVISNQSNIHLSDNPVWGLCCDVIR